MEPISFQLKNIIHHILKRYTVYQMNAEELCQLLTLIGQKYSEDPHQMQENLFRGVIRFHDQHKDHISNALLEKKFEGISLDVKSIAHKILHQFCFLRQIQGLKALQPHFIQPTLHSQNEKKQFNFRHLDDQIEKARLHYSYYGPMTCYSLSNEFSQTFPYSLEGFQQSLDQSKLQESLHRPRSKRQKKNPRNDELKESSFSSILHNQIQIKSLQPNIYHNSAFLNNSICEKMNQQRENAYRQNSRQKPQQRVINMKHCLCQGNLKNERTFKCQCCKYFHQKCQGSDFICLLCRQLNYNQFNSVVKLVGAFNMHWRSDVLKYEGMLNLFNQLYLLDETKFKSIISCAHPDYQDICWPDDIIFKINGHPVFYIPALLESHNQKRRKDKQIDLTPILSTFKSNPQASKQIKFSLEVVIQMSKSSEKKRNNRQGVFKLCFFSVKHIAPQQIFTKVAYSSIKNQKIAPFDWKFHQLQPESYAITVYDPFSLQPIECPTRGANCKHLQCFDLRIYLKIINSTEDQQWRCPICSNHIWSLIIDKYQQDLIQYLKSKEQIPKKIEFFRDGTIQYQWEQRIVLQQAEQREGQ